MKKQFGKMPVVASLLVFASALSACGGGGSSTPPAPPADHFAAYVGTWTGGCSNHAQGVATITTANSVMSLAFTTNYYDTATCTGPIVAVETSTGLMTAVSNGPITTQVILPPATAATSIAVDRLTVTIPQRSTTMTGTAVYAATDADGFAQMCVKYTNGESTCTQTGVTAAVTVTNAGSYVLGNNLYLMDSTNGVFSAERLIRQ